MTDQTLLKLRELLLNEFSEAELVSLCRDIGINYEALPGAGTFGKTREIVEAARAQDKLRALQSRLRELRPEAYAASGVATAMAVHATETEAPSPAMRERTLSGLPMSWIAVSLLALLCLVAGAALILPRLTERTTPGTSAQGASAGAAPSQPTGVAAGGMLTAVPDTSPDASAANPTTGVTPATPAAVEAMPTLVSLGSTPAATPLSALPQAMMTAEAPATAPAPPAGIPETTATAIPAAPRAAETHPAAQDIRGLNDQLPLFFTGQASTSDLENFWTGEALRSVTGFGNVRLPRAMRIQPSQRNALDVTFQYLREPAIVEESDTGAVVTSREFWRYANSVNPTEICEVRDYVYNMIKEGNRYRVRTFQSRLLETSCPAR